MALPPCWSNYIFPREKAKARRILLSTHEVYAFASTVSHQYLCMAGVVRNGASLARSLTRRNCERRAIEALFKRRNQSLLWSHTISPPPLFCVKAESASRMTVRNFLADVGRAEKEDGVEVGSIEVQFEVLIQVNSFIRV